MIYLVGYVSNERDVKILRDTAEYVGAMYEDDDAVECSVVGSSDGFTKQLFAKDRVDICCCDTLPAAVIDSVKNARAKFPDMQLVLIADEKTSPLTYIRPGVMPSSLLFKPLSQEQVHSTIDEVLHIAIKKENKTEGKYVLQTKQGRYILEYSQILYFEALDKRIYLNTANQSYPFYSTLDSLCDELPKGFIRCHKSYIVNTDNIISVDFSDSVIRVKGGMMIPVSRSYRAAIKELKI